MLSWHLFQQNMKGVIEPALDDNDQSIISQLFPGTPAKETMSEDREIIYPIIIKMLIGVSGSGWMPLATQSLLMSM
jgi:hypothetical protein